VQPRHQARLAREGAGEKDIVLLVYVLVQVLLETGEAGEEGAVRLAGTGVRAEAASELAQVVHGAPGMLVFLLHHANRVGDRAAVGRAGIAAVELADQRKENLLLLGRVQGHLVGEGGHRSGCLCMPRVAVGVDGDEAARLLQEDRQFAFHVGAAFASPAFPLAPQARPTLPASPRKESI
jgi:hypothetical protein